MAYFIWKRRLHCVLGILLALIGAAFLLFGILGLVSRLALGELYDLETGYVIVLSFVIAFGGMFSFLGIRLLRPRR
ncbi:MAG: hypothetical protein LBO67_07350 [Spirochaetaceae bacterium]|jgi:hypothetical protein|nr:hypothetical protein [Spirochaetaceae bacterium]